MIVALGREGKKQSEIDAHKHPHTAAMAAKLKTQPGQDKYAKDSVLFELERQAQADKRGLWADPDPVAPWEYRHNKRARSAS